MEVRNRFFLDIYLLNIEIPSLKQENTLPSFITKNMFLMLKKGENN